MLLLALFSTLSAHAGLWRGTITQTITETDDANFSVGQTYDGWYGYESDTIDGDFGPIIYAALNPGAIGTLTGEVFVYGAGVQLLESGSWSFVTHLTITDGAVSDFHREGQLGGVDYGFSSTLFGSSILNKVNVTHVKGTVMFGNPSAVPEAASTTLLLFSGLAGITLLRFSRRSRHR